LPIIYFVHLADTGDLEISENRPYFASETQSITADAGDKAVFQVQVKGKPKATLRWLVFLPLLRYRVTIFCLVQLGPVG